LLGGAAIGAGLTLAGGAYDADHPQRQWLTRIVEDEQVTVLRGPGPSFDRSLWLSGERLAAEREMADPIRQLPPPIVLDRQLEAAELPGHQRLSFRIQSPSGAPTLVLSVPGDAQLHDLRVEDTGPNPSALRRANRGATRLEIHNVPPEGVRIEAVLKDPSVPWRLADRRAWTDAPSSLRQPDAQTSWDGDTTWVITDVVP
jgi:hypothetical protein